MKKAVLLSVALTMTFPSVAWSAEPTTAASPDRAKQAQALADQAYDAYQRKDWNKAVSLYLDSYKLVPTAEVLFNVANIYDKKLNDKQTAIDFYRRHNASPDAEPSIIARANARVAELSQADKPAPAAAPATKPETKPEPEPKGKPGDPGASMRIAGYVVGAIGVVGLGVGAGTGLVAMSKASDAKSAGCSGGVCPDAASADKDKSAASMGNISTLGFVAGGVLAGVGITLVLVAPKADKERAPSAAALRLSPSVGPGSVGFTLSGLTF